MTETVAPATPAAPAAAPKAWHDGVDGAILGHWQNKNYDLSDPGKVAVEATKAALEAQKYVGVPANQLIRLPTDPNDTAGWQTVHQKLGVPKDPKEYNFGEVKFSDGSELDDTFVEAMRTALHKANVNKDVAGEVVKSVVKFFDDSEAAEKATTTATLNEQKAQLLREWGQNAEMNRLTAMQAVKRLGIDPATVEALEGVIGYHKVMEMFRKIGAGTSEDTFVGAGAGSPTTAGNAQARLTELQNDQAWVKRLMSGEVAARREFHALTEQISGFVAA